MAADKYNGGRGGKDYPFSASQGKVYDWCQLQYWFEYVSGYEPADVETRHMDLGNAVHEAIERTLENYTIDDFYNEARPAFYERAQHHDVPNDMMAKGEKCLKGANRVLTKLGKEVTHVEKEIEFTLGGPDKPFSKKIRSKLDIIADENEIWDWKTGRYGDDGDEWVQATIYKAAFTNEFGYEPTNIRFIYLSERDDNGGVVWEAYDPTSEDLEKAANMIHSILQSFEEQEFKANPDKPCRWCNYQLHCPYVDVSFADTSWEEFTEGFVGW